MLNFRISNLRPLLDLRRPKYPYVFTKTFFLKNFEFFYLTAILRLNYITVYDTIHIVKSSSFLSLCMLICLHLNYYVLIFDWS